MIKILLATALFFSNSLSAQQTFNKLSVKELDVTSRVNVASTTQSSKPCPAMTETQRNAIATPLNGSCIYNTTTSKLNVYNGSVWKAAGGGVDNWATATVYAVDDIVIQSSKIYQCLIAHTSGTFATDLAAVRWVEISSTVPVNLTGPITSVGNATSIASQTGTGSTFVVQNTPTLTTPNIGAATGTSLALAGNISAYNYDKDNLLVNGNIENPLGAEWTCTVGTCTRVTTAGQFSKDTAALRVALTAQAMNVSQTVTTPSGIQKQGFVRVIYRVPATMADFQICSLVDAVEQTCIPTNNLIKDDTFRTAEIPLTFGSTSAGIKFKTTSAYTGNAYFDGAIVAQGLGTQNLMLDNTFSARVSTTGVVSGESKDFISGNCVMSGTNNAVATCTFNSGYFTIAPTCAVTNSSTVNAVVRLQGDPTSSQVVFLGEQSGTPQPNNANVICQKSGNDYLTASSNVYSAASANYSRTSYTPTFTGFGTVTVSNCTHSREGEFLNLDCNFTSGTSTATEARVSLPNGLTVATGTPSLFKVGDFANTVNISVYGTVLAESSVGYVTLGISTASATGLVKQNGSAILSSGSVMSLQARVPISGWSNSNVIVGSFAGIETCKNSYECMDVFSADIGSTGAVSNENIDWISGNCTNANPIVCTFNTNLKDGTSALTNAMNCNATQNGTNVIGVYLNGFSSTQVSVRGFNTTTGAGQNPAFHLQCQKTGVDSKPKTAKVASSIGVPTVPGITTEAIDTFSFVFGTTNASTPCSASPCSYLNQIGTGATSVTRISTGIYNFNFNKTYSQLICTVTPIQTPNNPNVRTGPLSCTSCNVFSGITFGFSGTANYDVNATVMCQGSY